MKLKLQVFVGTLAVLCSSADLFGAVKVYEGFGDVVTEGDSIDGYSGTSAETGLTGTWTLNGTGSQKLTVRSNLEYVGVDGGYSAETTGGNQHWWEHNDNWDVNIATRPLSSTIDFSSDGTTYMSFFSMSGQNDFLAQVGLNDGTNELMFGNGYSGAANKGITAYYGAIGTDATTNGDGTFTEYGDATGYKTGLYVAQMIKSNSGTTNDLTVNLSYWDFGTMASPSNALDTADASRTVALSGVSTVFDTLELKLSGSGDNYPSLDEIRIGDTLADVTGVSGTVIEGDTNGDNIVDLETDYAAIRDNFLLSPATRAQGDIAGADIVDLEDFLLWRANYPFPSAVGVGSGASQAVPEPASWLLVALGVAAVASTRAALQRSNK